MWKDSKLPIHDQVFKHMDEAVLIVHTNGKIIRGNPSALSLLNIDKKDLSQLDIELFFDKDLLFSKDKSHIHTELKNFEGRFVDLHSLKVAENIYCFLMKEVSLKSKTVEVKNKIDQLIEASSEGLVMFNQDIIIDCDLEFASMFGYHKKEIQGMKINKLFTEISLKKIREVNQYYGMSHKLTGIKKDGGSLHIELTDHPYMNDEKMMRIAIVKDISEQVEHKKQLEYMAYYDELTDLPNRNYFLKMLKDAIDEATELNESLAVYFIDLDYFKEVNEILGYDFGDKLLKASGEKLKKFKDMNTFVARAGGDEFLIFQRNIIEDHHPVELAKSIISAFEIPITIESYEVFISISIGISVFPENGASAHDLIKHADSAMYVIKDEHRSSYKFFESSISEGFKMMLSMESDLRKAIKEEQFELYYQPQKCLQSKKIVGVEALLRWKHPRKGYIPPMEFIPLAEKTGLIIEIGDWVLREACKQNKQWQAEGYHPLIISVNLSARQLHQKDFANQIEQVLKETGLEAKYLELEITESMAMTNEHQILKTMNILRKLGVHVAIDDFGTGYSSLKYLSKFPVTKLKIDKVFINEQQKHNQAIVKSIINMSHSLNMKVIAEGVETLEQLQFLEREKCDEMQGFYFSKPLPPHELHDIFQLYLTDQ